MGVTHGSTGICGNYFNIYCSTDVDNAPREVDFDCSAPQHKAVTIIVLSHTTYVQCS